MKIGGDLARNIDFEAAEFRVRYENSWENVDFELQSMKKPRSFARNARFEAPANV